MSLTFLEERDRLGLLLILEGRSLRNCSHSVDIMFDKELNSLEEIPDSWITFCLSTFAFTALQHRKKETVTREKRRRVRKRNRKKKKKQNI